MLRDDVVAMLRRECRKAGSQAAWAQAHGLSAVYVSDVCSGRRAPAAAILTALGLERVVTYRRKKAQEDAGLPDLS
jgi:DNA-binding transcriptional regulator YdaS (Cro superfamily)